MFDHEIGNLGEVTENPGRELPDRALQSALEFSLAVALVSSKVRPPQPFPSVLKKFLKFQKLTAGALPVVRAAVEGDPEFLGRLAAVASPTMVDDIGLLWITRPDGWLDDALAIVSTNAIADADGGAPADARAERRRREAAETAAARARHHAVEVSADLARAREAAQQLASERDRLILDLAAARSVVRELESGARKRAATGKAVADRADVVTDEIEALRDRLVEAEAARDAALASRALDASTVDAERMRALLLEALALTGAASEGARKPKRRPARTPLPIPGGVYGNSEAAAEHLVRSPGVLVLVDGYNVAMLGWPDLALQHQRERCIQASETLARRWGVDVHVVFDGADVVGAHAPGRRSVRVTFSPEGVLADDVVRAEVVALDPGRPVVVVTNDNAVLTDVRSAGANTVSSAVFLALACR